MWVQVTRSRGKSRISNMTGRCKLCVLVTSPSSYKTFPLSYRLEASAGLSTCSCWLQAGRLSLANPGGLQGIGLPAHAHTMLQSKIYCSYGSTLSRYGWSRNLDTRSTLFPGLLYSYALFHSPYTMCTGPMSKRQIVEVTRSCGQGQSRTHNLDPGRFPCNVGTSH